jgi:hypothetical protein
MAERSRNQTSGSASSVWRTFSLAKGDAGVALMCGYVDECYPDAGWDVIGHQYLTVAATGISQLPDPPLGLFEGLCGVAFATSSLSRGSSRYRKLQDTLDVAIDERAKVLASRPIGIANDGMSVHQFDLISGLCGVGVYLLHRHDCQRQSPALVPLLRWLLKACAPPDAGMLPRWFTPPHMAPTMQYAYPYGSMNCGLAHGIAGPLALFSLAYSAGIVIEGLPEAIHGLASWLIEQGVRSDGAPGWPAAVPLLVNGQPGRSQVSRPGWCYGNPGVARALWLAGRALNDPDIGRVSTDGMVMVYSQPSEQRGLRSPNLCHGVAGLMQVAMRYSIDTGLPVHADACATLVGELIEMRQEDAVLGYRDEDLDGTPVDCPSFLTGAAGVAMSLIATAHGVVPKWHRILLLG